MSLIDSEIDILNLKMKTSHSNMKVIRRKRVATSCTDCAHSMFDENWGELKCKKLQRRILNQKDYAACQHYQKKTDG